MASRLLAFFAILVVAAAPARAVLSDGVYQTTAPSGSDIANWASGWGAPTLTGWDYVGRVGGASGVYLGNGWVLTAAHVGAGSFTLSGTTYSLVPGSSRGITNANGTADLTLFQISGPPALPVLSLRSTAPSVASFSVTGSTVAMIGFGGGQGKSWGANTVTLANQLINVNGAITSAFGTVYGSKTYNGPGNQSRTINNPATLVGGDSGGGGFIYNATASRWELAGIHSAVGTLNTGENYSFMVQLDVYRSQILSITAVPEPGLTAAMFALGLFVVISGRAAVKRRRPAPATRTA